MVVVVLVGGGGGCASALPTMLVEILATRASAYQLCLLKVGLGQGGGREGNFVQTTRPPFWPVIERNPKVFDDSVSTLASVGAMVQASDGQIRLTKQALKNSFGYHVAYCLRMLPPPYPY